MPVNSQRNLPNPINKLAARPLNAVLVAFFLVATVAVLLGPASRHRRLPRRTQSPKRLRAR